MTRYDSMNYMIDDLCEQRLASFGLRGGEKMSCVHECIACIVHSCIRADQRTTRASLLVEHAPQSTCDLCDSDMHASRRSQFIYIKEMEKVWLSARESRGANFIPPLL